MTGADPSTFTVACAAQGAPPLRPRTPFERWPYHVVRPPRHARVLCPCKLASSWSSPKSLCSPALSHLMRPGASDRRHNSVTDDSCLCGRTTIGKPLMPSTFSGGTKFSACPHSMIGLVETVFIRCFKDKRLKRGNRQWLTD